MLIFTLVFLKILSSLLSVLIGFCAGKYSDVEKESIASLLFYFVAPIVFFAIPTSSNMHFSDLGIIIVTFSMTTLLGVFNFWIYGKVWQDNHRNILALSGGTGNGSYMVLPIATAIFDDHTLNIYALGIIGVAIYEASVGCYFCARSVSSIKDSVLKIIKLPILNAFIIGCIMNLSGFELPNFLDEFINNMKGSFSILGMVVIGLAMSKIKEFKLDLKFTSAAFISKFLFFPAAFNIFIFIDYYIMHWYDENYYDALQLISLAPMATNTIVLASIYKIHPEKVATAVLMSLLFALIYMPIMSVIFLTTPII